MATAFAAQLRAAGTYSSPEAPVSKLKDHDVQVAPVGIPAGDLADPALKLTQVVVANDAASGNAGGWYVIYGPDDWTGGNTGHDGQPVQPGFIFRNSGVPDSAVRLRLDVTSSKSATWGFNTTVV